MKVAGGGPSVHACAVFFRAESRDGDKLGQTPYCEPQISIFFAPLTQRVPKPHLRGPTGTMALPPWAAAEEGLGWPRGDCSLRWAMRPAIEVGVVGAGVAGVLPVPAVT